MGRTSGAAERLRGRIDSEGWSGVRRLQRRKMERAPGFAGRRKRGELKAAPPGGARWLEAAKLTGAASGYRYRSRLDGAAAALLAIRHAP